MGVTKAVLSREAALQLLPEVLQGRHEEKAPKPFPWQERLLLEFLEGNLPRALDLPTGLGKTSVMALWLLARAAGAPLPRRLVYIVDRRVVVDQATEVAERLHEFVQARVELRSALGVGNSGLPVSTLRGKHLDNRKWLEDPSSPAIIVGTVDMIGSRLLFQGYGVSWKMRPYHAGLLGADSLFVLDEAHLVPPFERVLEAVAAAAERKLGPKPEAQELIPPARLLSLSATGRTARGLFQLDAADRADPEVKKRIEAKKVVDLTPHSEAKNLANNLAEIAWGLGDRNTRRILVFCDSRKDAETVASDLANFSRKNKQVADIELFVGARRVHERELAAQWLRDHGFIAGAEPPDKPTFLVATSAAEVGVDLDADAAVMDLVEWERMVQRMGRVNRRGERDARIVVVPVKPEESKKKKKKKDDEEQEKDERTLRREACFELLKKLSVDESSASPAALASLRERWPQLVESASTPPPLHPPLTRPLLDAWSMTSLVEHSGRPKVEPWLRGWQEKAIPETTIVFRRYLPLLRHGSRTEVFDPATLDSFLEAAGPSMAEELVVECPDALRWLRKRVEKFAKDAAQENRLPEVEDQIVAVVVRSPKEAWPVTKKLLDDSRRRAEIERRLPGAFLFVDVQLGGLEHGLLNDGLALPKEPDALDLALGATELPFRVRYQRATNPDEWAEGAAGAISALPLGNGDGTWRAESSFAIAVDADGEPTEWIVIERRADAPPASEAGRSVARKEQELTEHHRWAEDEARALAERLEVADEVAGALIAAARLHDEGKRARRWQEAFAPNPKQYRDKGIVLAKSTRSPRLSILGRYRHELGSLSYMLADPAVQELDENARDLALHLVAAHHGRARPVLPTDDAEEPPTKLRMRAREVALRFDRLTRHFGPWGLAWLEALLRAADQQASRRLEG